MLGPRSLGLVLQRVGAVDAAHEAQRLAEGRGSAPGYDEERGEAAVVRAQSHQEHLPLEGPAAALEVGRLEHGPPQLAPGEALAQLEQPRPLALQLGALQALHPGTHHCNGREVGLGYSGFW